MLQTIRPLTLLTRLLTTRRKGLGPKAKPQEFNHLVYATCKDETLVDLETGLSHCRRRDGMLANFQIAILEIQQTDGVQ